MATMIKGIYKSFKNISKIFAAKEPEIEIGNPTDVKHVAHIGSDGSSDSTPSWMNDFNVSSDGEGRDPNTIAPSTRISKEPKARSDIVKDIRSNNFPNAPKKQKRKKSKPTSSPKSPSPLTRSRESRPAKPKSK